jgi:hypothetical protein
MARSTRPLLLKGLGLVALTALSIGPAPAQPVGTPVRDDDTRLLKDFLDGDPAAPTRVKTCRVVSSGAKQSHKGRPGGITPPGTPPPALPPGEFSAQVFVTCSLDGPAPRLPAIFFVPVTPEDQVFASQALSVMGAAHLSGKLLRITFDPADTSGNQMGCVPRVCKRILAIHMTDAGQ